MNIYKQIDNLFIYTDLTDIDWDDKFYTSPNCTNKIHYLLIETPHRYCDDIGPTLIPIFSCMSIDWLTGYCKH